MNALERAIRAALAKGDASDRAFREKIYRSALSVLERRLADAASPESEVAAQRANLHETIVKVETECLAADRAARAQAATSPAAPARPPLPAQAAPIRAEREPAPVSPASPIDRAPPPVSPQPPRNNQAPAAGASNQRVEPSFGQNEPAHEDHDPFGQHFEPFLDQPDDQLGHAMPDEFRIDSDLDETVPGESRVTRRKNRKAGLSFLTIGIVAVLGLGWWTYDSGFLTSSASRDTAVRTAPNLEDGEGYDPANDTTPRAPNLGPRGAGQADDVPAIEIFSPQDRNLITAPTDAKIEYIVEGANAHIRMQSGKSGSAVLFDVKSDILEKLSGKTALFMIEASAEEDQPTQMSVSCNFGDLGSCGRQRYEIGYQRGEYIFEVTLPARSPGSDGTIAIVSDIENQGKALDIYSIKAIIQ